MHLTYLDAHGDMLRNEKCKCLHGNLDANYKMVDAVLDSTVKEKDLGVTISTDFRSFRAVWYCSFKK